MRWWRYGLLALACALVAVVGHDLAVIALVNLMAQATRLDAVQRLVVTLVGDEVYGRLILSMLGNMQLRGLALSPAVEAALRPFAGGLLAPSAYLNPAGDWTGVVFTSGSSAVGAQVAQVAVNLAMVALGACLLLAAPRPGRRLLLAVPGVLWLAYGAGAELRLSWGAGSGGEMALSMVATKVVGLHSAGYDRLMQHNLAVSMAVNGLCLAGALGLAWAAMRAGALLRRRPLPNPLPKRQGTRQLAWSCLGLVALMYSSVTSAAAFEVSAAAPQPALAGHTRLAAMASLWPSVVTVDFDATARRWVYSVNGQPETIRGIGYNAITANEPPAARAATFDRDFAEISASGANTIVGWSETEFDDLLMDKANEHGLGVILPFLIGPAYVNSGPDYQYEDPRVRQQLLDHISQRVIHYRNSPALRIWGLGNEVLHAIRWAHGSPAHMQAFADFLVQAADMVHQLDPNHPVVYRDAEDWYAAPIIRALAEHPKPRPWFIYGMNFFSVRMEQALDSGPTASMDQPLLISEFGPVGLRPAARPGGYAALWDIIRGHSNHVLGGLAYVWTTAGPEPLDRNFGLTDAAGQPVDGALAELSSLYRTQP